MQIERAADDVANAFLLERLLFEAKLPREHDGRGRRPRRRRRVHGLRRRRFEGFLPARRLGGRDDWWELNEAGTILTGEPSGATVRIGETIPVLIRRIDPPRGRVELDLDRSSGPSRRA